jgi:large subunit ribosomal protein L19
VERIEIEKESEPMRARLYYLRDRQGKAAMAVKRKAYDAQASATA